MTSTPSIGPEQLAEAEMILTTATTASNYIAKIDSIAKLLIEVMQMLSINVTRGISDQVQSIADAIARTRQEQDEITSHLSTIEKSTSVEMTDMNLVLGELKDVTSELQDRVTSNERMSGKGQGQPSRSVLDSKAVMNLRTISTKSEYRAWNEKLVNALATVRPKAREVMDYIRKMIDMGALSVDRSQYDAQPFATERPWESFSEDLYAILIDKAENEALTRVRSVKPGESIRAYFILHKWFTETTGMVIA